MANNALNLPEIDQVQALNLTKFFIQSNQNIFLFGRRGVGKTHIAIQAAQECKLKINYINLSVIERPDLAGYPDMNVPGDIINFKSPYFLPPLQEGQTPDSVILFDEVDKAPAEVTAPLLEILLFKKINGRPINATGCILTGNLMNEGAYSNAISTALLDRGAKYILSFNFDKWVDWAKSHGVHDLILGFLRSDPNFACGQIEDSAYASPSPRSWTLASEALSKTKELRMSDIESVTYIISGYVGNEAGVRFKIWYEHYRKFEPYIRALIENNNLSIDFSALPPTEKLVFVVSACYHAKQKMLGDKTKNKFVYLERLCEFFIKQNVEQETQLMGLTNAFDFDMIAKYKLYSCTVFYDMFTRLREGTTIRK
jgi:IstB-like ATP binding protein